MSTINLSRFFLKFIPQDPDPDPHFFKDPDPWTQKNADPADPGSGSASLIFIVIFIQPRIQNTIKKCLFKNRKQNTVLVKSQLNLSLRQNNIYKLLFFLL